MQQANDTPDMNVDQTQATTRENYRKKIMKKKENICSTSKLVTVEGGKNRYLSAEFSTRKTTGNTSVS